MSPSAANPLTHVTDDLRMTYGFYGWLTDDTDDLRTIRMSYARVCACQLPLASAPSAYKSELASVAFHQVGELVPVISTVSTPSFWTLVCIMSGRRSSRKTRKNPPVSEQPQQPPQAEEEGQEVEEGPSLAELTVPPPPTTWLWQGTWEKKGQYGQEEA